MADEPKKPKADVILETCNRMREDLWPLWCRERRLVAYYNSGPLPFDQDECSDDVPISLGLGYRYIKRPLDGLLDVVLTKPGMVKAEVCYPVVPERKFLVEGALDTEANAIIHERMESTIRQICGRAMITGRAFFFRLSRWDWRFKAGRLLSAIDDCDDVNDESFREWAFVGQISLREIESLLADSRGREGVAGWSNQSLQALKEYIVSTTLNEKTPVEEVRRVASQPFNQELSNKPLDVYWYFRKNGKRNDNGDEGIDLSCVSRWGGNAGIRSAQSDGVTYRALSVTFAREKEQIIYHWPNAFESIGECLIPMLLDARIDGEQEMHQIDGVGKIMTPRLQSMEHITVALLEGIAFGVQPNWTSTGNAVDEKTIELLQRTGINPWDYVPQGLKILDKNNAMQGMSQAMQMVQMLGVSAEADAQTGEMSAFGESQARFKAEAVQMLSQIVTGFQRRIEKSFSTLDRVTEQMNSTLCRIFSAWRKSDPAYYDVRRFQTNLLVIHKIHPAEYSGYRVKSKCRRLAGNMEKGKAAQQAEHMVQVWGGVMAPQGVRWLGKQAASALYDDVIAQYLYPDEKEPPQNQVQSAQAQNAMAIVSLQVPQRMPGDDPLVHLPYHISCLEARLKIAQQQGNISGAEREGLAALLVHTTQDARAVPPQQQAKIGQILKQIATTIQGMQVQGSPEDAALKQRAQQLKEAQFGFSQLREKNLVEDRNKKHDLKLNQFMLSIQQFLEDQKSAGVDRAKQLLEMMQPLGNGSPMSSDSNVSEPQPAQAA